MDMNETLACVAVDWGTSNLRVWLMDANGHVFAQLESDKGMGSLAPDEFEPALLDLIADNLPDGQVTPIVCCGMVGARQGWQEADYATAPCKAPGATDAMHVASNDPRIAVSILPGVKQVGPDDVMRGEETQIAGFLSQNPKFDGVICLPGTHTKWVRVSAEEIVSFQTYMTGEIFALLSESSVLRHSVSTDDFDDNAFQDALSETISRPQSVASKLFGLRAAHLVSGQSAGESKARLSGYLLGLELAGARPYWLGMDIALIGAPALCALYENGLASQGGLAKTYSVDDMTLAGLTAAYSDLKEPSS